jgi:hypothetical protein
MHAFSRRLLFATLALVSAAALALPAAALAAQPFSIVGSWDGYVTVSPTSDPGVLSITNDGRGHATRIGVFSLTALQLDNFSTGAVSDGAFKWTTPAGDTIIGTYSGSFVRPDPSTVAFTAPGAITGGIGRFKGASGSLVFSGTGSVITRDFSGTLVGTLTLPK